jgi:hypothetical protein
MKTHLICFLVLMLLSKSTAVGQESSSGGGVSGTVEDPSSAPIAGATLKLISLDRVLHTVSSSKGFFEFGNLQPGVYMIEITAPGFARNTIPLTIQEGSLNQTISVVLKVGNMPDMEKCGRDISIKYELLDSSSPNLTGTLRDYFGGKLIVNAEVKIMSETNRQTPVIVWSDRDGRFTVKHLAPDYYNIQISCKNFESEQLKHVAIPRENKVVIDSSLRKRKQVAICQ